MKRHSTLIAVFLVSITAGIQLVARDNPRVARLDIQRYEIQSPSTYDSLRKRQHTVEQALDHSEKTYYYADVSLGTPAQSFRLWIATGSGDMWVNTANASVCLTDNACGKSGIYNANRSSTYKYVAGGFNVSYTDRTGARGDYVTDVLSIGGQTVPDMPFGVGYNSTSSDAVLGIGYATAPYSNLPQKLAKDGKINSNAYSLWLNDLDASTGSILFGGVDTAKYTGSLRSVPIIPTDGVYSSPQITLTAFGQNETYIPISDSGIRTILESGITFSYLPSNMTATLYRQFNATLDSSSGVATVDCSLANQPGTIDFSFSGVNISVPIRTLVSQFSTSRGPVCVFGIATSNENSVSTASLGLSFLRSAYVVFDLDNNQISLAQTRFNVTEERIVEIAKGTGGVPTSVFNTPTSSPTSRGGAATNTFTTNSGGSPEDGGGDSSSELSTGAKAGIGVGVVAGVAILAGAALLLLKRRRRMQAQPDAAKPPTSQAGCNLPEFVGRA